MSFGSRLKEERTRLGLTQAKFAEAASASTRSIASWEAGEAKPTAEMLSNLAGISVDVNYVLTGLRSLDPNGGVSPSKRPRTGEMLLAKGGLKLDVNGEVCHADVEYVTNIYLGSKNREQVEVFLNLIHSPDYELSAGTYGRALYLIDRYGVSGEDLYELVLMLSLDFTVASKRG